MKTRYSTVYLTIILVITVGLWSCQPTADPQPTSAGLRVAAKAPNAPNGGQAVDTLYVVARAPGVVEPAWATVIGANWVAIFFKLYPQYQAILYSPQKKQYMAVTDPVDPKMTKAVMEPCKDCQEHDQEVLNAITEIIKQLQTEYPDEELTGDKGYELITERLNERGFRLATPTLRHTPELQQLAKRYAPTAEELQQTGEKGLTGHDLIDAEEFEQHDDQPELPTSDFWAEFCNRVKEWFS